MNRISSQTIKNGVIGILVIAVIILALSGYLNPIIRLVMNPVVSVQTWIAQRYMAIQNLLVAPTDLVRIQQRNVELEAEISRLQLQVIELQQQVTEAQVLSSLVDYARTRSESRYIAAGVIGYDTSPFIKYILINRGSDDGIRRGMPVVTNQGLVGQVSAVIAGAARVQLITNPGSSVSVRLQQADAEAIMAGLVTGDLGLEMIPQNAAVNPGDLVVTSGLGGNYPPNLVIGQVTTVRRRDFDLFQTASVQPAVDFRKLEIVLIITNFQPVDTSPLVPAPAAP